MRSAKNSEIIKDQSKMRKRIVAGNWKMHKTLEEGLDLARDIRARLQGRCSEEKEVILFPPFIHLTGIAELLKGLTGFHSGGQNCHHKKEGAYTGEISASMLASAGASHVIIGHSERRKYFGEDDALLAAKTERALEAKLTPVFCCGETLEERESEKQFEVVGRQIRKALFHLPEEKIRSLHIAYEPVWAIGTGRSASPEAASEMHAFIRSEVAAQYGRECAESLSILYGGSVKPGNAAELFAMPDIDGGLIGGASLQAADFEAIFNAL